MITQGRGRTVDEWKPIPGRDNHWFDCLIGAAVAASITGAELKMGKPVKRERVRWSEKYGRGW